MVERRERRKGGVTGGDPVVLRPLARKGVCMPSSVVRRMTESVMGTYRVVGPTIEACYADSVAESLSARWESNG